MPKTRLEAFSDGVFAIVITLLILEVRPGDAGQPALEMIGSALPKILSWVLSFVVVGTYWVAHHRMVHAFRVVDRNLLWLNLLLLMVVAFIPYPTALIGTTHADPAAVRLYGATMIAANVVGASMWRYGMRWARGEDAAAMVMRRRVTAIHLAPVVPYAIGIAIAGRWPIVALSCFAAVPSVFVLAGPWIDRYARMSAA